MVIKFQNVKIDRKTKRYWQVAGPQVFQGKSEEKEEKEVRLWDELDALNRKIEENQRRPMR